MNAKFFNPEIMDYEIVDTDNLENDSREEWTEKQLLDYIYDICPEARDVNIINYL
jgi:hypothetical protein